MYDKKKSHCVCSGKSSEDETLLSFEKVKCFNPVNYNWGYLDATSRLSIASKLKNLSINIQRLTDSNFEQT